MSILLASEVLDLSAAALNDANKTQYTYEVQIPYLKLAMQELQEIFELNSLAVTEKSSAAIPVDAGITKIIFNAPSQPRLPDNLIEPQQLFQRLRNLDNWSALSRSSWKWQDNEITLISSNTDNDIRIDYIGSLFPKYIREDTIIPVLNGQNFLAFRTAGLIADLIENNEQRSSVNNSNATLALDRISGISIKSKQSIVARRRPFRSNFKRHG